MSDEIEQQENERERSPISPALRSSLAAAKLAPLDRGGEALALRYAELLDEAVAAQKYVSALRLVGQVIDYRVAEYNDRPGQQAMASQLSTAWDRISSALAEHSVASDLGPKLLAAMTSLNLTPAAREKKTPAASKGGEVVELPANPLQAARDRARAARERTGS